MQTMPINIGMKEKEHREIAQGLSKLLTDGAENVFHK